MIWPALGLVCLWALAAAASPRVGFWTGMGSAALALGLLASIADHSLWRLTFPIGLGAALYGAGSGLLMAVAAWVLYPALAVAAPWLSSDKAGLYAEFAALTPIHAALLLPAIIAGEELVWRGLVQHALTRRFGPIVALPLVAGLYGAATLPCRSPLLALAALGCGLVWSTLRLTGRGLIAPMVSHLTWAALVLFVRPVRLG
ncbi:MAG TPA: CPBP family intramembrane glutamic endopeptidase [Polyangia bacterium]|nr:CPBP family intramembrane glutamic endopeptidase [Polyangia bacterium]